MLVLPMRWPVFELEASEPAELAGDTAEDRTEEMAGTEDRADTGVEGTGVGIGMVQTLLVVGVAAGVDQAAVATAGAVVAAGAVVPADVVVAADVVVGALGLLVHQHADSTRANPSDTQSTPPTSFSRPVFQHPPWDNISP